MTTTNANNASKLTPPAALSAVSSAKSDGIVAGYFRQSSDGTNFTVTPVYLHPSDLARAVATNPGEYSTTISGFAAWPNAYNNSAQTVGGRGRLQSAPNVAD
ncbi:MAG: hypothetical protein ABSF67_00065 [Roseiarcus sp.]|jgi:hypothetical protein